jgi:hypothetical protein
MNEMIGKLNPLADVIYSNIHVSKKGKIKLIWEVHEPVLERKYIYIQKSSKMYFLQNIQELTNRKKTTRSQGRHGFIPFYTEDTKER